MEKAKAKERLEVLRQAIREESMSYAELVELQSLASFIDPGDVELLEPAGIPEHAAEYVTFTKTPEGDLRIELLPTGREYLEDLKADPFYLSSEGELADPAIFLGLIEHQLCNGWSMVPPEQIGALTSSIILSDDYQTNDHGDCIACGRVYWFPDYALKLECEELLEHGFLVLEGAD